MLPMAAAKCRKNSKGTWGAFRDAAAAAATLCQCGGHMLPDHPFDISRQSCSSTRAYGALLLRRGRASLLPQWLARCACLVPGGAGRPAGARSFPPAERRQSRCENIGHPFGSSVHPPWFRLRLRRSTPPGGMAWVRGSGNRALRILQRARSCFDFAGTASLRRARREPRAGGRRASLHAASPRDGPVPQGVAHKRGERCRCIKKWRRRARPKPRAPAP